MKGLSRLSFSSFIELLGFLFNMKNAIIAPTTKTVIIIPAIPPPPIPDFFPLLLLDELVLPSDLCPGLVRLLGGGEYGGGGGAGPEDHELPSILPKWNHKSKSAHILKKKNVIHREKKRVH